jgi:hypothetical protein
MFERRTYVELDDVLGIEIECPDCHGKVVSPLGKDFKDFSNECTNCNRELFTTKQPSNVISELKTLIRAINSLVGQSGLQSLKNDKGTPLKVRLQVNIGDSH